MRYLALLALSLGLVASAETTVTLYQGGFAFVEEEKALVLEDGKAVIAGLPATVAAGSLSWEGIEAESWEIVVPKTGLDFLVGEEVLVSYAGRTARGILVGTEGGLLLETAEGYLFIPDYESILSEVKPLLEGLPALVLHPSAKPETEAVKLRYLARELSWEAFYLGHYADGTLLLRGIALLHNGSGRAFQGARVHLVAGEVFGPKGGGVYEGRAVMPMAAAPAPEVAPVGEYHRYSLPGEVDIPRGESMVEYLSETPIPVREIYRFAGGRVLFILGFTNTSGVPLPAGTVRVFGEGVFLGEASIGHTPVDERVELPLGVAFDLKGERVRTEYVRLAKDRYRESYRISLRSAKDETVEVEVIEELTGEWRITTSSHPYVVLDSHRIKFVVPVPAKGEAELTYTVEYRY